MRSSKTRAAPRTACATLNFRAVGSSMSLNDRQKTACVGSGAGEHEATPRGTGWARDRSFFGPLRNDCMLRLARSVPLVVGRRRRRRRVNPPPGTPSVGLDARPSNTTLRRAGEDVGRRGRHDRGERAFPSLTFNQPLLMLQAPGDDSRWFVLEKAAGERHARVRVFANTPNVATASTFCSVTVNANSEGGLLGMAFHPNLASNRQVFLSFTEGSPMVSRIARYTSCERRCDARHDDARERHPRESADRQPQRRAHRVRPERRLPLHRFRRRRRRRRSGQHRPRHDRPARFVFCAST